MGPYGRLYGSYEYRNELLTKIGVLIGPSPVTYIIDGTILWDMRVMLLLLRTMGLNRELSNPSVYAAFLEPVSDRLTVLDPPWIRDNALWPLSKSLHAREVIR